MLLYLLACGDKVVVDTVDADADGVLDEDDCDDTDPEVFPGADEVCDGVDQDCDGEIDEGVRIQIGADADGDGYASDDDPFPACEAVEGSSSVFGDCDDADPEVHPGATEDCDGEDDDCDGVPDQSGLWYTDADGDGYGDPETEVVTCVPGGDQVADGTDCDDGDAEIHPGAEERCDEHDDDCDGRPDEGVVGTWYTDADGDGWGDSATAEETCGPSVDQVAVAGDCRDTDGAAWPGADERCNDLDDDCDGEIDEGMDADGDGYDSVICDGGDDCEDDDPAVHPYADDACEDGLDADCDGTDTTCGFDGDYLLTNADTKLYAPAANNDAGRVMATGDNDGDGHLEVLAGALYANGYAGGAWLVDPEVSGTAAMDTQGYLLSGVRASEEAGRCVAMGDVDGDGLSDAAFGAPFGSGGMWIFLGPVAADTDSSAADVAVTGNSSIYAGHGCALGDVSGDGVLDALVGAYGDTMSGAVRVVNGPLTGTMDIDAYDARLTGEEANSYAGRVVTAGDLTGDGIDDLVTGGPASINLSYDGVVYVVHGPVPAELDMSAADGRYVGEVASAYAGITLAIGDLDGDGLGDLGIGAYDATGAGHRGVAYVVNGPADADVGLGSADVRVEGDASQQYAGSGVDIEDMDGDGVGELLVGGRGDGTSGADAGAAWLFPALAAGTWDVGDADIRFLGESATDLVGAAVALADIDADGLSEVILGAPGEGTGGSAAGAVYVFYPGE